MIANDAIPRGGSVRIELNREESGGQTVIRARIRADGSGAQLGEGVETAFDLGADILRSLSRTMPNCNSEDENLLVKNARRLMAAYSNMEELIRLGAYGIRSVAW